MERQIRSSIIEGGSERPRRYLRLANYPSGREGGLAASSRPPRPPSPESLTPEQFLTNGPDDAARCRH